MYDIEKNISFDEIRTLLKGHCISRLGTERVDEMSFSTDVEQIRFAAGGCDTGREGVFKHVAGDTGVLADNYFRLVVAAVVIA